MGPKSSGSVHDTIRKKRVADGPEERVRQAVLKYLVEHHQVPEGLISVESQVQGSPRKYRSDITIYDRTGNAWMLVECKAPDVSVRQAGMDQLGRYNRYIRAPFVMITNGIDHFCAHVDSETGHVSFLDVLPVYPDSA